MEWFGTLASALFGAIVGSFLNVIVLRFGFTESPRARSHCQACQEHLRWYELLPVVSFFALSGRCGHCGSRISYQYPLVESSLAVLYAASYATLLPFSVATTGLLFSWWVLWAAFVALTVYDIRHRLVPPTFALALFIAALFARSIEALMFSSAAPLIDGAIGAIIVGGFLLALVIITRGRGMGDGDPFVGVGVGFFLGAVPGASALVFSFWIGAVVGLTLLLFSTVHTLSLSIRRTTMKSELPFIPFLFIGVLMTTFTALSPLELVEPFSTLLYASLF